MQQFLNRLKPQIFSLFESLNQVSEKQNLYFKLFFTKDMSFDRFCSKFFKLDKKVLCCPHSSSLSVFHVSKKTWVSVRSSAHRSLFVVIE